MIKRTDSEIKAKILALRAEAESGHTARGHLIAIIAQADALEWVLGIDSALSSMTPPPPRKRRPS